MSRSSCGFANCLLLCPRSCPDWWDPGLLHVFTFDQYLTRRMRLLVFIQYLVNIFFSSINIWSIFWFSINIWSIFDLIDATSSLLANIGCTGVGYCLLGSPQESTFGFTPKVCLVSFLASTGCKGRKTHRKNWCYRQWCHIQVKEILLTTCSRPGKWDLDGCPPMTLWPFRKTR